jgi:integrase
MSRRILYEKRKLKSEARLAKRLEAIPFPGDANGSLRAMINLYVRSHGYMQLALQSKRIYYRALKRIGHDDLQLTTELSTRHINQAVTSMTPGMASQYIAVGSAFYNWVGINNPFAKIKKPKCGEWEAWTIEDVKLAALNYPPPTKSSLLLFLAAFTGQRWSDIQDMRWPDLKSYKSLDEMTDDAIRKGVMLTLTQKKTGEEMFIPIPGPLFTYYAKMVRPTDDPYDTTRLLLKYIYVDRGDHIFQEAVGHMARRMSDLVGKPFHGLRKTCSWLLAEGECSVHEIAAVTGHRTMTMLTRYTKLAEKKKMAQSALIKMTRRLEDGSRDIARSEVDDRLCTGHLHGGGTRGEQADARGAEPKGKRGDDDEVPEDQQRRSAAVVARVPHELPRS